MNYRLHYDRLIDRAKTRTLSGYKERHHILPRCLGGDDSSENVCDLTPEEHYTAHLLLVKIYPCNSKLIYAARMMAYMSDEKRRTNKLYGWLRRLKAPMLEETKQKIGEKSRNISEETRLKMSQSAKARGIPAEQRAKMIAGCVGNKRSDETKAKMSKSIREALVKRKGIPKIAPPCSEEKKAKISASLAGRKLSEETKLKMREGHAKRKLKMSISS